MYVCMFIYTLKSFISVKCYILNYEVTVVTVLSNLRRPYSELDVLTIQFVFTIGCQTVQYQLCSSRSAITAAQRRMEVKRV